jgi:molecular chaperone GrpE
VTEEETRVHDEPIQSFIREDEETGTTAQGAVDEVLEGEVIEEAMDEIAEVMPEAAEEAEEIDELTALRLQLAEAQAKADEYLDDLRRERAAFQNFKKRQENGRVELHQMAVSGLVVQILPIIDDLERALEAIPEDQLDQPWVEGVKLIQRKLHMTLEAAGVVPVEAEAGQPFDPFVHEAVTYEEDADRQEGEIIAVVQKGYRLNQRTLRPATVRVAK